jgi:OOP family OmpA-OmpF porin
MNLNLKLTAAMAALTLALVPAAFAQEQEEVSGFYLGGGAGQFNASIDDVDDIDETVDSWDDDDTAYKFFAGYRLNRFVAFELDYINLGEPSGAVVPGRNVDAAVDGFAPYVVGTLPLGQYFEVYGRAGYYFYDATTGVTDDARQPRGVRRGIGGLVLRRGHRRQHRREVQHSRSSTRSST